MGPTSIVYRFSRRISGLIAAAGLLVLAAGGCHKAAGERCQVNSDCDDGLICELTGSMVSMGGVCRTPLVAPPPDLSVAQDMAAPVATDGGPTDAGDGGGG